jgi:hypothetical protein
MSSGYGKSTCPMGEIRPHLDGIGTIRALRLVGSQPQLIGEDLPPIDGYGAHLTHGNNFGGDPYWGQVLEDRRRKSVPGAIADVIEVLRQSGKKAGVDTAAAVSIQTGAPITEAALEVISTRKMGRSELESRLATNRAALAQARSKGQRARARRLKVRIVALEKRLGEVSMGQTQAVKDLPGVAGDSQRIPAWVTYAGVGLGALSVLIALAGTRKRR